MRITVEDRQTLPYQVPASRLSRESSKRLRDRHNRHLVNTTCTATEVDLIRKHFKYKNRTWLRAILVGQRSLGFLEDLAALSLPAARVARW